jgi:Arc/MetJ family transcription regulator
MTGGMTAGDFRIRFHRCWSDLVGTLVVSYHRRMDREHVELDTALVNEVRDMVGVAQTTEFISRAIRHELRLGHLSQLLHELETDLGPLPEDLQAEADAFWHAG